MIPTRLFHFGKLGSGRFHDLVGFVGAGSSIDPRWSYDTPIASNTLLNEGGEVSVIVSAKIQVSIDTERPRDVGIVET